MDNRTKVFYLFWVKQLMKYHRVIHLQLKGEYHVFNDNIAERKPSDEKGKNIEWNMLDFQDPNEEAIEVFLA